MSRMRCTDCTDRRHGVTDELVVSLRPSIVGAHRYAILLLALLIPACNARGAAGQDRIDRTAEGKVKVGYIHNFCRYFEWPTGAFQDTRSPLVIGVLGGDPFGARLDALAMRKTVKGRKIVISRFKSNEDYHPVHVLFVPRATSTELHQWALQHTRGKPVLVIGESVGFAKQGATVNFFDDANGTIGFEVNADAVLHQQLEVNPKLLKLADVVRE